MDGSSMAAAAAAAMASNDAAAAQQLSATLGVGIKEYMNVPWMPVLDIEPTGGNSLDPSAPPDRREHSGRGFVGGGGSRPSSSTAKNHTAATVDGTTAEDEFPYDQLTVRNNGTAADDDINEPVLRPKSRFRMYRMPDGSNGTAAQGGGGGGNSSVTAERSFIVHLLPQRLMNMIEHAERYARMAFSPFMWPSKERTQRALKYFPRYVWKK